VRCTVGGSLSAARGHTTPHPTTRNRDRGGKEVISNRSKEAERTQTLPTGVARQRRPSAAFRGRSVDDPQVARHHGDSKAPSADPMSAPSRLVARVLDRAVVRGKSAFVERRRSESRGRESKLGRNGKRRMRPKAGHRGAGPNAALFLCASRDGASERLSAAMDCGTVPRTRHVSGRAGIGQETSRGQSRAARRRRSIEFPSSPPPPPERPSDRARLTPSESTTTSRVLSRESIRQPHVPRRVRSQQTPRLALR